MPRAAFRAARASTSNTERDACDAFDPRDRPRREDRVGEDRDHVGRNDEDDDDEASSTATENGGDARERGDCARRAGERQGCALARD